VFKADSLHHFHFVVSPCSALGLGTDRRTDLLERGGLFLSVLCPAFGNIVERWSSTVSGPNENEPLVEGEGAVLRGASATADPVAQRHVQEGLNCEQHRCDELNVAGLQFVSLRFLL